MAFVYVPNGVNQSCWWPKKDAKEFELNRTMQPLERLKDQVQVIAGLDQQNAFGGKDGPGDHARACATFLTGRPGQEDRRLPTSTRASRSTRSPPGRSAT